MIDLHREILEELKRYSARIERDIAASSKATAQQLVKDLKRTSPKKSGDYRKGWRIKRSGKKYIVHNATNYQLTHLLEHGFVKRNGDRKEGKAHIRPAEEKAIRSFLNAVEEAVENDS